MSLGNDGGKLVAVVVPSFSQEVFLIHETSVKSHETRWRDRTVFSKYDRIINPQGPVLIQQLAIGLSIPGGRGRLT